MHVGVPSLSGGASGPNLYHSNYDSFHFYENFVDPAFQMGPMVEQLAGLMALTMANGELIPYDLNRYAEDLKLHFKTATQKILNYHSAFKGFKKTETAIAQLKDVSAQLSKGIASFLKEAQVNKRKLNALNQQLIGLEKVFISEKGMYFWSMV